MADNIFILIPIMKIIINFGKNNFMKVIGRSHEKKQLATILEEKKPSFLAVYGRRRVGKTFLIKEYFNHKFTFYATGLANSTTKA